MFREIDDGTPLTIDSLLGIFYLGFYHSLGIAAASRDTPLLLTFDRTTKPNCTIWPICNLRDSGKIQTARTVAGA